MKKVVVYFICFVISIAVTAWLYWLKPGWFWLQRDGLRDEYIDSYVSCMESSHGSGINKELYYSYNHAFDKEVMELIANRKCDDLPLVCAEKHLIMANQYSNSVMKATTMAQAVSRGDNALSNLMLAKEFLGDDLLVRASGEMLAANFDSLGLNLKAEKIFKLIDYSGGSKSRYNCYKANRIFYANMSYRLFVSGRCFDSIYIGKELVPMDERDLREVFLAKKAR